MIIQVYQELCTGCGTCVDVCSEEAIRLVDNRAMIDDSLCIQCEACIEACQNNAIVEFPKPERSSAILNLPLPVSGPISLRNQPMQRESKAPARGLAPLAGAALAFLGSEVAPRLVDVLITTLERRLTQPTPTIRSFSSSQMRHTTAQNRSKRKQTRYHGDCTSTRIHKGRR
jgi:NAD-dependent dihydropyrimidine dehydrogenase PreA subunit